MCDHIPHDSATLGVLPLTSNASNVDLSTEEDAADADEPPDLSPSSSPIANHFKRTPIRRGSEHHESLLTKALLSHSDEEAHERHALTRQRRRSITSNVSVASTADLTCDTAMTTPARTSSPSPRLPGIGFAHQSNGNSSLAKPSDEGAKLPQPLVGAKDATVQALEKKRCISFACAAKPTPRDVVLSPPLYQLPTRSPPKPTSEAPPKRTTIKFACPARPSTNDTLSRQPEPAARTPAPKSMLQKDGPPSAAHKNRSPSTVRSVRSLTPKRTPQNSTPITSNKYLMPNSKDLQSECSKFHEFASDEPQEDDWIRIDGTLSRGRITIDDTLEKENAIRKLAKEAEEEAELEDEIEGNGNGDDDDDDGDDDDDDDDKTAGANDDGDLDNDDLEPGEEDENLDFDDDYSGYGSDDDASDGYNTDNEVGFAESEDEDDDLVLWTTGQASKLTIVGPGPIRRRASIGETCSDSSTRMKPRHRGSRTKDVVIRPGTPELPDSTDFVCGTLDEDRPLEEAYISCLAARRLEKLHPIPQDIDPSFPTSEPEDEVEDMYKHGYQANDDHMWPHGELEDLHHEGDRGDRRKKKDHSPPKRHHSPAPKRHHSPAPKGRGRSPRRLFEGQSPRRWRSPPPPQFARSPPASPIQAGQKIAYKSLAFRPGLVYTKSLPRTPAVFSHMKKRVRAGTLTKGDHVRGAIDIVKGLEQKRQRRKEKFYQKYCNRARKNQAQAQGRRPLPGQGAQRMRELGLTMAGKIGPGKYVLSV